MVIEDLSGNLFLVPELREPVALYLLLEGGYEIDVVELVLASISGAGVFLDVGANIGAYTVPVARHLARGGGRVIAIEASLGIARYLARNLEMNRLTNVDVIIEAAAAQASSRAFYEPPRDHFGMGSLAPQFGVSPTPVKARTIDSMLEDLSLKKVDVMKVDVEGYEREVFAGAVSLLTSNEAPLIVFEFCDWAEERAVAGSAGSAQRLLMEYGYRLWKFSDYLAGDRLALSEPMRLGFETIVASRDESLRSLRAGT